MRRNKLATLILILLAFSAYLIFWGVEHGAGSHGFAVIALPATLFATTGILVWNAAARK